MSLVGDLVLAIIVASLALAILEVGAAILWDFIRYHEWVIWAAFLVPTAILTGIAWWWWLS